MKKWMIVLVLAGAPAVFGADTNTAPPGKPADRLVELFGDPVVAKGKGLEIKRSQLEAEVTRTKEALAAGNKPAPPDVDKQVLDGLIGLKLLLARANDADRAKAKEQFEKQFTNFKTQRKLSDEEFSQSLARQLKMEGRTREEWEKQQIEQLTLPIIIQREISVPLQEPQGKKYYEENTSKFEEPEMVKVSHILLSTRDPNDPNPDPSAKKELSEDVKKAKHKQIEDLLKRARAGEDFAKLAKENSEDPSVKQNNGEYKFSREDRFVEEFKAAAFSLKSNEVSDVVTTVYGYHILKLLEKTPARKEAYAGLDTKTIYNKADGQKYSIRDILSDEGLKKQLPDYIKKLKMDAGVEVLDPKLKMEEAASTAANK